MNDRGFTFRGYAQRRPFVADDRPTSGQELRNHSSKKASRDLSSGDDLGDRFSEGARLNGMSGDDAGDDE